MNRLEINFRYPLLLLVFLVGLALTAVLYFTLDRRYRKTRSRITSIVLHLIVYALAVLTLAGTVFSYTIPNKENEIILVVDVSDTENESKEARDNFIETVLSQGRYDNYRIGIVTFGFDQRYAVPLTSNVDSILGAYLAAEEPDASATDIAAALNYAAGLFTKTETAKIVLVTDGKETDEKADSVIRTIAAKGIKVDTAYIPSSYEEKDALLTGVTLPDYHVTPGNDCSVSASVFSDFETDLLVELYDNDNLVGTEQITAARGSQSVSFNLAFDGYGLHRLTFRIKDLKDGLEQNNLYHSYLYLEAFNKVLILEQQDESAQLRKLLTTGDASYDVTVLNVRTSDAMPKTVNDLREYDQVILNNIANRDMSEEFVAALYSYVNDYGGGLFTVGGSDVGGKAHAYNRADMLNSVYQSMLPVQAINYTPPVGVMIIIDRSGSMDAAAGSDGSTRLDYALAGATSCLSALSERDYIGLMTLDSEYETILPLTPRSQESKIINAINKVDDMGSGGGTVFPAAIERASQALRSLDVAKRHIIIVTDGQVPNSQVDEYESYIKYYHDTDGITLSVVGIGVDVGSDAAEKMKHATDLGGGRLHLVSGADLIREMREDLNAPNIKEINYETFTPIAKNTMHTLFSGVDFFVDENDKRTAKMLVTLDGFYGVKAKGAADIVLVGDYEVPIYAQWRFGKGMVGSFMCDLSGAWSADFLNLSGAGSDSGRKFLLNVIAGLLPVESVRDSEINVSITEDNYTHTASIFTELDEGEKLIGIIRNLTSGMQESVSMSEITVAPDGTPLSALSCYVTLPLTASNNYSRLGFVLKESGVYELEFIKQDAEGNTVATVTEYLAISYSEEYDTSIDYTDDELKANLKNLALHGSGSAIADLEDPVEIFADFITAITRTYDPRILFMILALVLFLLDIAARKFKYKWPHELIREYREKHRK